MFKLWFMASMIFIVANIINSIWKTIVNDKDLTSKLKIFAGSVILIAVSLIYIPILYWAYRWLWQ